LLSRAVSAKKEAVQARFLLGPAGSGKTFRCLSEIREALRQSPDGPPLILIAPKQATFQLERQLLDGDLRGYTRLQILSFERLAYFVLRQSGTAIPRLLSEEGRLMVLRALVERHASSLKVFRASARSAGLIQQLSQTLRELQQHQLSPADLRKRAQHLRADLAQKLGDLCLLLDAYTAWLAENNLQDAERLLDIAAQTLRRSSASADTSGEWRIAGLWMDGFAEMTPQELDLLAAVISRSAEATLAFCLDGLPSEELPWLSAWSTVAQTFRACQNRLSGLPNCAIQIETLPATNQPGRFHGRPALEHIEKFWNAPRPFDGDSSSVASSLRLVTCPSPEAEAICAAREIRTFVRDRGGRFRDVAVLLRDFEGYHDLLRRVFSRYEIPFFLDRREPATHHPLAELTRGALRTIAFGWQHDDWFGALKSGLVCANDDALDRLENEALARGWKGSAWLQPLKNKAGDASWAEQLRTKILPPFLELRRQLAGAGEQTTSFCPTGNQLAAALRPFWQQLDIEQRLEAWSALLAKDSPAGWSAALHQTVWHEMNAWLENIARAFGDQPLPLREWLSVLESGLAGLTAGAIPPALDQVLIGTIDRSRNPDLRLAIVLGLNETVFPRRPESTGLLSELDRADLERAGLRLSTERQHLAQERYYGYIAFTRSRERFVLLSSEVDRSGKMLNPSFFVSRIETFFGLKPEKFLPSTSWPESEHACELLGRMVKNRVQATQRDSALEAIEGWDVFQPMRDTLGLFQSRQATQRLAPDIADQLYGKTIETSVTRLEAFAECPFRFFVASGLGAEERRKLELDARQQGTFQHAVLSRFQKQLKAEGRKWRDVSPDDAAKRVERIANETMAEFGEGLLNSDARSQFSARVMTRLLQQFIRTAIEWMQHNEFEPNASELSFGVGEKALPPCELKIDEGRTLRLRGIIDRVDICATSEGAFAIVVDYKSRGKQVDPLLLANGIELQLLSYMLMLRSAAALEPLLGVGPVIPAGVFYAGLRGKYRSASNRSEAAENSSQVRHSAYQHSGRFADQWRHKLDASNESGQFKMSSRSNDALKGGGFEALLRRTEERLRQIALEIFDGNIEIDPYTKGSVKACAKCDYQRICRIDPWEHEYRMLRRPA
jgi:ATP-dependent helicase/nuclease subunit B